MVDEKEKEHDAETEIVENGRLILGNSVYVMITTRDYVVKGDLYLPVNTGAANPTPENLLFYVLNCGNMFITLRNCVITTKDTIEYIPERVECYNINLNIVESCRIIDDEVR